MPRADGDPLATSGPATFETLARTVMVLAPAMSAMKILDSVEQLRASLDYHLARHNLLAANLAQADTPGFRPMDLERTGTFASELHTAMAATEPGHIEAPHSSTGGVAGVGGEAWRVIQDPTAASGNDGNGVSLDREAVKIAANQLRYDTLASLVQNQLAGLEWAANDGKIG